MRSESRVAIIGGGASGALLAYQISSQCRTIQTLVFDPAPIPGLGLAYSTPCMDHVLNVPAHRISALPDQPSHFLNWLRLNHDASADEGTFAPRPVFGRYLQTLWSAAASAQPISAQHISATVTALKPQECGYLLTLSDGTQQHVEVVVLATGHFLPANLPRLSLSQDQQHLFAPVPWPQAVYQDLPPSSDILLIGSGLTAVDVLLRLRARGHTGVVTMLSRHAQLPLRHAAFQPLSASAIPSDAPPSLLAYLRILRNCLRSGQPWRAIIDSIRAQENALWLRLPVQEQRRFRRHLQRRWDNLRHRMAPPIADKVDAELSAGTLKLVRGSVAEIGFSDGNALVHAIHQGQRALYTAARVIHCTGPNMDYAHAGSSLYASLFSKGLVTHGPLGNGILCRPHSGAVIDSSGNVSSNLFALGPARLGTLFESVAIPEIRQQCFDLAQLLAQW